MVILALDLYTRGRTYCRCNGEKEKKKEEGLITQNNHYYEKEKCMMLNMIEANKWMTMSPLSLSCCVCLISVSVWSSVVIKFASTGDYGTDLDDKTLMRRKSESILQAGNLFFFFFQIRRGNVPF